MLSGPIGDHGIAILLAREALDIEIGGTRVLDMLVGDPLPRIC